MLCPHCNVQMQEVTKTGVILDVCPQCKGTWLDRGELEKILNRAREVEREWENERTYLTHRPRDYEDDDRRYRKKRWTEIFDIFD
jgi:uncharacterized protein